MFHYTRRVMSFSPHILITRPEGQHKAMAAACEKLGFRVSHLPCLVIKLIGSEHLDSEPAISFDSVVFTSVNAVKGAAALRSFPWPDIAVYAVGPATANALAECGQTLIAQPRAPYNSEALLAQLVVQKPGRVLIVKGEGGRTKLAHSLISAGWVVQACNVYQRQLPAIDKPRLSEIFDSNPPDIISVTSNEVLNNLLILAAAYKPVLLSRPLIVNSQRAADAAVRAGFTQQPLVAQSAGDQGQLDRLQRWMLLT